MPDGLQRRLDSDQSPLNWGLRVATARGVGVSLLAALLSIPAESPYTLIVCLSSGLGHGAAAMVEIGLAARSQTLCRLLALAFVVTIIQGAGVAFALLEPHYVRGASQGGPDHGWSAAWAHVMGAEAERFAIAMALWSTYCVACGVTACARVTRFGIVAQTATSTGVAAGWGVFVAAPATALITRDAGMLFFAAATVLIIAVPLAGLTPSIYGFLDRFTAFPAFLRRNLASTSTPHHQ